MRKITDYEEFMGLWNISHKNRYWGTKKITPEQEKDIIARADIKDFKRYNIYMLEDNYHFIVIDTKWTIDSDLYYDDEMDAPEVTLEYFKAKNRYNIKYHKLEDTEYIKPYFMINYCNNDRQLCICSSSRMGNYMNNLEYAKEKNLFVRYLTDEEIKQYNDIVEQLTIEYDERLDKYFKRYNKNIYAIGYWVNR